MTFAESFPGGSLTKPGDEIVVNIFGDATMISRFLGLEINLPDCENVDPAYWETINADGGFKSRIADKVCDPWFNGDPDWAKLLQLPWGEVWFDIEEGIKLYLMAHDIDKAVLLIRDLEKSGVSLHMEKEQSSVWVQAKVLEDQGLLRVKEHLELNGFVQGINEIVWTLPSDKKRPSTRR